MRDQTHWKMICLVHSTEIKYKPLDVSELKMDRKVAIRATGCEGELLEL